MHKILLIAFSLLLMSCSDISSITSLKWQYDHSTNVAHVKVLRSLPMEVPGHSCHTIVWEFEAVEVFKGALMPGEKSQVWGPNDPNYWNNGSDRLMFIKDYEMEGDDPCSKHLFANYKQVHWSCCEIKGEGSEENVHFYTMINSEEPGPDLVVKSEMVFTLLRAYE